MTLVPPAVNLFAHRFVEILQSALFHL